ncbi:GNAT family N-acetyltransferase [uncultured Anaerococcus sp.]|uniref:GNAT family N-acetyltransferase n=1 Tax=uncultured Anaerococcus sp. TaxID=293428 RepID=UPI0025D9B670|nr:GNAT family N-acetyltransferase [uncultured Anaerococcus sp.]
MDIEIEKGLVPDLDGLINLYDDCGWTAYTNEPETLKKSIEKSLDIWTLWDGKTLVGLARTVGDGVTICYLQDILILKAYQGKGLGTRLLEMVLNDNSHIRQFVLLTEDSKKNRRFYEKSGLKPVNTYGCLSFMR